MVSMFSTGVDKLVLVLLCHFLVMTLINFLPSLLSPHAIKFQAHLTAANHRFLCVL